MDKPMDYTYINIQSWMINELNLKGNELMIYAIIYGFCQDKKSRFKGGRSYLAKWTNSTTRGVQKNLNNLVSKGMIAKDEKIVNGIKVCDYYPINLPWERTSVQNDVKNEDALPASDTMENVKDFGEQKKDFEGREQSSPVGNKVPRGGEQSSPGVGNKVPWGGEQSSHHNIKGNIKGNIKSTTTSIDDGIQLQSVSSDASVVETVTKEWNKLKKFGITPISKISLSSKRYRLLKDILQEYSTDDILCALDNISKSNFLQGKTESGFKITFDWFIDLDNFLKVFEGNYDYDKDTTTKNKRKGNQFNDFNQRDRSAEETTEIEKMLLNN